MNTLRNILFQIHLWVGLGLGLLFILLGLSGSLLVYPGLMAGGRGEAPAATTAGAQLPLEQIIAAARAASPQNANAGATVTLPQDGEAAGVRFTTGRGGFPGRGDGRGEGFGRRDGGGGAGRDGGGRRGGRGDFAGRGGRGGGNGPQIFVDPVSGKVLASTTQAPSRVTGMAHQIHESMMLGRNGRMVVGGLGIFMLFLGLSGVYLWWPKSGQWKYAFIVRPSARGARLYREIHGAFGIWFLLIFLVVTATGLPLAFPGMMGGDRPGGGDGPPPAAFAQRQGANAPQAIDVPDGAPLRPLAELVTAAERTTGLKARSLTVPARPDRPVTVTMAQEEEGPPPTVTVNPYTGDAATRAPAAGPPRRQGLSIRGLHAGDGLGPIYKALVFASGLLPLLFVVTGFLMWLKKRQARRRPA